MREQGQTHQAETAESRRVFAEQMKQSRQEREE